MDTEVTDMLDILIVLILLVICGGAAFSIRRAKKRGQTCIGCPHAKNCGGSCGAFPK